MPKNKMTGHPYLEKYSFGPIILLFLKKDTERVIILIGYLFLKDTSQKIFSWTFSGILIISVSKWTNQWLSIQSGTI